MTLQLDIEKLESLAELMDSRFRIPGTGIRFGLDAVIGLIPGVGDAVTLLPTLYIISQAQKHGAAGHIQAAMVFNAALDLVIGAVPLLGDLFDVGFKANHRNVRLLKRHLDRRADAAIPVNDPSFR
tara:strand:+ start:5632 stop:6009 length:378 start_codon:yes stop_codon:yes gene_type:complete